MNSQDIGDKLNRAAESTFARLLARVVTPFLLAMIWYFVSGQLTDLKTATNKIGLLSYKIDQIQGEVVDASKKFYTETEASKDQVTQSVRDQTQDSSLQRLQGQVDENSKKIQDLEIRVGNGNPAR